MNVCLCRMYGCAGAGGLRQLLSDLQEPQDAAEYRVKIQVGQGFYLGVWADRVRSRGRSNEQANPTYFTLLLAP